MLRRAMSKGKRDEVGFLFSFFLPFSLAFISFLLFLPLAAIQFLIPTGAS